ncbi:MAG: hydantoinase/oxoprolinase family protein [Proteobacteria bacterium]|nr:hydantoinase/oxoprolinase family protein [Pseudomonadota bacterium]
MAIRIGVDTGGTHTDLVLVDDTAGRLFTLKVPTTPDDLADGILDGVREILGQASAEPGAVAHFVYGTTLITNLIIEGNPTPVGLIATEGFRDVLAIARASRKPNVYDIHWRPPAPLVPRELRFTVPERIDYTGAVITPLDEDRARETLGALSRAGVGSIAVCLINAYANPAHERRIRDIAAEVCPGIAVSISSDVVREFREFERMSTTVMNAYVERALGRHLDGLSQRLTDSGIAARPMIMRSNGGLMTFNAAKALPVAITHSGPMGGIVGGTAIAVAAGLQDIITLDMGGTSADVSLISRGQPLLTTRGRLGSHPVLVPMLDLVAIGAGGGSIGWLATGGAMKVGPRSAGARPGPACYGQGGTEPTVTDANLLVGRLNADYFLAGARRLDPRLAEHAIRERLAKPLGMSIAAAAAGVLAITESHMVNAIKLISVQRGLDPRDFTLVAFGGCGPLHALKLAEELSIGKVLVPAAPGNVSAWGLLAADVRHDLVRTRVQPLADVTAAALAASLDELLHESRDRSDAEGTPEATRRFVAAVDLRYQGQNYEITLPLPLAERNKWSETDWAELADRFAAEHLKLYGYTLPERPVIMVNLRLTAIGAIARPRWPGAPKASGDPRPLARRKVTLAPDRIEAVPVYSIDQLDDGHRIDGPAIVEHPGSTLFLPDGWRARYDGARNAHIARPSESDR